MADEDEPESPGLADDEDHNPVLAGLQEAMRAAEALEPGVVAPTRPPAHASVAFQAAVDGRRVAPVSGGAAAPDSVAADDVDVDALFSAAFEPGSAEPAENATPGETATADQASPDDTFDVVVDDEAEPVGAAEALDRVAAQPSPSKLEGQPRTTPPPPPPPRPRQKTRDAAVPTSAASQTVEREPDLLELSGRFRGVDRQPSKPAMQTDSVRERPVAVAARGSPIQTALLMIIAGLLAVIAFYLYKLSEDAAAEPLPAAPALPPPPLPPPPPPLPPPTAKAAEPEPEPEPLPPAPGAASTPETEQTDDPIVVVDNEAPAPAAAQSAAPRKDRSTLKANRRRARKKRTPKEPTTEEPTADPFTESPVPPVSEANVAAPAPETPETDG